MIDAADERAIIAVLTRYGSGIDRRDWPLFRSCFSEDCIADYAGFGRWQGPDEITAYMEEAHAPLGSTLHRMTNFVIDGDNHEATARSYVDALLMPAKPEGEVHRGVGFYDDELVARDGQWRIRRRRFTAVQII
jgi:3-phenylpropionate/cinnamic acid dioxygenase small subunit